MKTINLLYSIILISSLAFLSSCASSKAKTDKLYNKLKDNNFTFVAQEAFPTGMYPLELYKNYELNVSPDSVITTLPYYGLNNKIVGADHDFINHSTNQFSFLKRKTEEGNYEVYIAPMENKNEYSDEMFLTVYNDGTAKLSVINKYRDVISYNGLVYANK